MKKAENDINKSLPIFPISTLASVLNVHQRTLRIWDKEGILSPKRTEKNRRHYSLNDIEKGKVILFLTRNIATSICAVKLFLTMLDRAGIDDDKKLDYLKSLAKNAKISEEEQLENIKKIESKGRKTSSLSN